MNVGLEIQTVTSGQSPDKLVHSMQVWIMPTLTEKLRVEAEHRGSTATEFARLLLETVIRDNLFAAVLDD